MLRLASSVPFLPLVVAYCPTASMWSPVTKDQCEGQGCKCVEFFSDPTKCSDCGECFDATDCTQSSHPVCSRNLMCVECMVNSDCTSASNPACDGWECKPTCGTSSYQCKTGMRVDVLNDHVCSGVECKDRECCGDCHGDGDCTDPSSPVCQSSPYEASKCTECTSNDHCGDKSVCFLGKCSACQDGNSICGGPCVAGRFECELPCTLDGDCRVEEGELCAVNPGESESTASAMRCQRPCSSNQDCGVPVFNDVLHTCLEVDGRSFCGQCSEDSHCSAGKACQPTNYNTGRCTDSNHVTGILSLAV